MLIEMNGCMIDIHIDAYEYGNKNGMKRYFNRVWMTLGNIKLKEKKNDKLSKNYILANIWCNMQFLKCHYCKKLEYQAKDLAQSLNV